VRVEYASIIANYLLVLHSLDQWPNRWSVSFNNNLLRTAGQCNRQRLQIELSAAHVAVQDENEEGERAIHEIVLHEIAHALTKGGHNEEWRRKAIEIGASGQREPPSWMRRPPTPFQLRCLVCGCVGPRYVKPIVKVLCPACTRRKRGGGPKRFDERFLMVVEEVRV